MQSFTKVKLLPRADVKRVRKYMLENVKQMTSEDEKLYKELNREANKQWELAYQARSTHNHKDEKFHTELAFEYDNKARQLKAKYIDWV